MGWLGGYDDDYMDPRPSQKKLARIQMDLDERNAGMRRPCIIYEGTNSQSEALVVAWGIQEGDTVAVIEWPNGKLSFEEIDYVRFTDFGRHAERKP